MEDYSRWFELLNSWLERGVIADYAGVAQKTLSVGDIVHYAPDDMHTSAVSAINSRQFR
jgi:hypothetical protein